MAKLALRVNGANREVETDDPEVPLTGSKFGCGLAQCGVCTVLANGRAVRSCNVPARSVVCEKIVTIEGLGSPARPEPLQAAFDLLHWRKSPSLSTAGKGASPCNWA